MPYTITKPTKPIVRTMQSYYSRNSFDYDDHTIIKIIIIIDTQASLHAIYHDEAHCDDHTITLFTKNRANFVIYMSTHT